MANSNSTNTQSDNFDTGMAWRKTEPEAMNNAEFAEFQNGTAPDDARLNTSGLTIYDDRILVAIDETKKKTPGGIILPDSMIEKEEISQVFATVISVGRYAFIDMAEQHRPKTGDKILMAKYAGTLVNGPADDKPYRIVSEIDMLAKVTV